MTTYQMPLFDSPKPIAPCDPNVSKEEVPRLSRQCKAILEMLKEGKKTNVELARVAIKYSGRISDLRAVGCGIEVVWRDRTNGLTLYELKHVPAGL